MHDFVQQIKCDVQCMMADEIYRHDNLSLFMVDGYSSRGYCQSLVQFARYFLDHRTLHSDVAHFYFYVLLHNDVNLGHPRFVGFFLKVTDCYLMGVIVTFSWFFVVEFLLIFLIYQLARTLS